MSCLTSLHLGITSLDDLEFAAYCICFFSLPYSPSFSESSRSKGQHGYSASSANMVQQPDRMSRGFAISVLKNRGYAFKTSSDTNRLEQLVDRAERGLISYEKRYHFLKSLRSLVVFINASTARLPSSDSFVLRGRYQSRREAGRCI